MASFNYHLNPLYAIKECSSCGALYTRKCSCSKGSLEDKILGALIRKTLEEVFQDFQDTSESSDDDTNFVNENQEPFVVNQDPGKNSSQSPPQINHNCCYECGDSLDGIFCQQCTCKSCEKCAYISYNCPPKALIISNPEPCNQTIDKLPQTLPSIDPTCYSEKENSLPYVSKPNFVDDSPNAFDPPSQPPMYSCEFYENDARYGHYCTPQVPFIYPKPCYNQEFNFPQDFYDFQQQYLWCEDYGGSHETFECQLLNYYEPNPCYDSNYSSYDQFDNFLPQQFPCSENCGGPHETYQRQPMNEDYYHEKNSCYDYNSFCFDQFQPPQYTFNHPISNKEEEKRITEEQAAKDRYWKIPICYNDDEDDTIAITPVSSTKEPVDSLIMEDEHLDTILATESDEVIKSSFKEHSETIIDSNNDYSSSDDNIEYVEASPPDSEIVSLEVVEIVIPEVGGIDDDILLTIKDDILREKLLNVNLLIANIEALKDNPTPSSGFVTKSPSTFLNLFLEETNTFDNSLPEFETFCFDLEENNSGSTTTHSDFSLSKYDSFIFDLSINPFPPADRSDFYHEEFADELAHIISPSEYDCFCFKNEPEMGDFTMDVVNDIFPTREPRVHVPNVLPTHPTLDLDLDFILFSDSLFAYIVWIFLPFLTYPVAHLYLLSCGNEYTIFDPDIFVYYSFMPGISHRNGTFMKFNVYPNNLNESLMESLSSACSLMDQ
ncbi:hypothetical protein Tco_1295380 [Tanacetum coccineum]